MHLQVPQEMAFSSLAAAAEWVELGALGPPVEFPEGLSSLCGLCRNMWVARVDPASGAFGGYPYGATRRVRGVPKSAGGRWADRAAWALSGVP